MTDKKPKFLEDETENQFSWVYTYKPYEYVIVENVDMIKDSKHKVTKLVRMEKK